MNPIDESPDEDESEDEAKQTVAGAALNAGAEVVGAAAEVAGGAAEAAGGCLEGCGGCAAAMLLMLFGAAGTAMAFFS
jgi:hypothetical protein